MNITAKLFGGRKLLTLTFHSLKIIHKQNFRNFHPNKLRFFNYRTYLSFCVWNISRQYMDLSSVLRMIEEKVPPHLSESWDNTGLLVEPSNKDTISTILFTNDLTETVLEEALSVNSDLIISYHPPIFAPIKALRKSNWKDRIVIKCLENSVAVYSPHTSCDAVKAGVNDWLISCFDISDCLPLHTSYESKLKYSHIVEFSVPLNKDSICQQIQLVPDSELCDKSIDSDRQKLRVKVNKSSLNLIMQLLSGTVDPSSISIISLNPVPIPTCGMGRIGNLVKPLSLAECITLVKSHLKLDFIRFSQSVSHSLESSISTVAVCAGSGSSVLKGVNADLYITGEMSHHDLLDANHKNTSVILCEHSNSERGYLKHLAESLRSKLSGVKLIISSSDKDPVNII